MSGTQNTSGTDLMERNHEHFIGQPTIAYLTPAIHGPHQPQWLGMVDAAQEHDVNLICIPGWSLHDPRGFQSQATILYELVNTQVFDGVVSWASSIGNFVDIDELTAFHERYRPLPIVTIGRALKGVPALIMDSYDGMRETITHLIEVHGYRRITFIRGPEGHFYAQERYRAYCETLEAADIPIEPRLISPPFHWDYADGVKAMRLLLDERKLRPQKDFEVVVAANDELILGAVETLQKRGFQIPGDVAAVGFDNTIPGQTHTPPLTSVAAPFYKTGYQAVETLLSVIKGDSVPEEIVVPSKMVVRQSCGCLDPTVVQAVVEAQTRKISRTFEGAFSAERTHILEEMRQALEISAEDFPLKWAEELLDAFAKALRESLPNKFLQTLTHLLRQIGAEDDKASSTSGQNVLAWQHVISAMHHQILPCFGEQDTHLLHRAENLWRQARVMLGEVAQRVQARQEFRSEQRAQTLREIGKTLITTFEVKGLMEVLAQGLPRLHIPSCYVALYSDTHSYEYPQPTPAQSRLVLEYAATVSPSNDQNSPQKAYVRVSEAGPFFPSHYLVPEGKLPDQRRFSLVAMPLYFRQEQIGLALCEIGPRNGDVYDILRGELSSALQGALLVQSVQEHAHELAAAYEEIHILNEQLKEENVRMGAELDVARRLQEMILPPPEELQQIQELDIVGFMQPADEVGGDYYDIFQSGDTLHIGIGDVTGHGLESGMLMLMTQTAIRTLIDHGETDPVVFLNTLNRVLYDNIQRMHADRTLTLAFVNYHNGILKIIGQHEEMLVVRKDGHVERMDTINLGFPIGLEEEISKWVDSATVSLQPGDGVVFYTDGITEAENMQREMYGVERLCSIVRQHWENSSETIKRAVIDDVLRHIGQQKVYDDLTLVVMKQQ